MKETWRSALAVSGGLLLCGGALHPKADVSRPFLQSTALMLANPTWTISHAFILASDVVLVVALVGLVWRAGLPSAMKGPARAALIGALLSIVEMSFHLAAVVDLPALVAGRSAPILNAHLTIAVVAYPLSGFSMAALAFVGGQKRYLGSPAMSWLGVLGGIASGIAAPIVVITRDQHYAPLFTGGAAMALWMVLAAVWPVNTAVTPADRAPDCS